MTGKTHISQLAEDLWKEQILVCCSRYASNRKQPTVLYVYFSWDCHHQILLAAATPFSFYSPEAWMVGLLVYLIEPLLDPQASMARTTFIDSWSPSGTPPKTTCFPSNHEVTTVVTKNWDPLLRTALVRVV